MASLEALIPEIAAYQQAQNQGQRRQMGQLQQMGALQEILARQQQAQAQQAGMQEQAQMQGVLQQAGGNPEAVIQRLMASGNPKAIELATKIKSAYKDRFSPAGDGILNTGTGDVAPNPYTKEARPQNPSNLGRLIAERDSLPENDPRRPAYENAIRKESETARQITPPVINVNAGQPRAPVGFQFKDDGTLEPIKGGPKDPTINLTGGRESVYVQRMMMGANQAAKDLSNVVQLPLTASTGFLGGRRQGAGLLDAGKEVLANKATGQDAQAYNAMATGFQRSLAQIESAGLMPSGSLTHQMDAVLFKEGDTNMTKMHKLAQTRQIVEAGMEVINANPRVSPQEKEKINSVLQSIRKSVPFTHSDLIQLQIAQETNPNASLKDVIGQKGAAPKQGDKSTSKSGKAMTFDGAKWVYD